MAVLQRTFIRMLEDYGFDVFNMEMIRRQNNIHMPKKPLKQNLSQLSKDQLIKHIIELDKRYKSVKEYHSIFFYQKFDEMITKYKKIPKSPKQKPTHHGHNKV